MDFFSALRSSCEKRNSLLCIGLDPRIPGIDVKHPPEDIADRIVSVNRRIIEQTLDYAACYKPNSAFYEQFGPGGLTALERTIAEIPGDVPVILDAKRNDIGATAEAYAASAFDHYGVSAITLNPYMGKSSIDPFLAYPGKGYFILCRTSNEGAAKVQELSVAEDNLPLYLHMADECISWDPARIGLVVAGNDLTALTTIRERHPDCWFLAPGIGAQGGNIEDSVAAGIASDGMGILPMVARSIANASSPKEAARDYRDALNKARDKALSARAANSGSTGTSAAAAGLISARRKEVLSGVINTGCFKLGKFVLKSGKESPFYLDLRRISADPNVLKVVAKGYAELLDGLRYDHIAGIPVAGLPFSTAVSLEKGVPMIYPRMTAKGHGTGNKVEGAFKPGDRVVLLDDLITTGKSKLEAVDILRGAGLIVEDLVVLIERGVQGRKDMETAGITLHSYAQVEELFTRCLDLGMINEEKEKELISFSKS